MTAHTKDTLGSPRISQVLNLPLAVSTSEACRAEGLLAGKDGQVFNLVATSTAAVGAIIADKGAIAKEK